MITANNGVTMRIVYFGAILLGMSLSAVAEPAGQQTWQDIVRSTQERKPAVVEEPPTPAVETNTLYKVVDENGVPSFTDVAPNEEEVESFEVDAKPSLNVLGDKSDQRKQYERKINQQAEYRKKQAAQRKQAIQQAEAAVAKAKALQQEGADPIDGDWQNTNKGRRFLKESYFSRNQQLADSVEKAEQRLQELKRK